MQMRLESTKIAMLWSPLSVIGYAWVCQERVNVAAVCVMLFLAGFLSVYVQFILYCIFSLIHDRWIYASTLAYLVDANIGRSSIAIAANSSFRGLFAFVAAEIAVPLQVSQDHNSSQNVGSEASSGCYWRRWFIYSMGRCDSHR